jgi:serine protease Do
MRYLLSCLLVALLWTPLPAQRGDSEFFKTNTQVLTAFKSVVDGPSKSTVEVICKDKSVALGTIVSEDGFILTKASQLVEDPSCYLKDGRKLSAKVVGVHDAYDLALLKIDAVNLKPVTWRSSKEVAVGSWAITPKLGELPAAIGVVSVGSRTVTARDLPRPTNMKGGYLGVSLAPSEDGIRITQVMPDTAAAKAKLESDDIILAVDGVEFEDVEKLIEMIQSKMPGDTVTFRIKREEEEKDYKVTLGKRPPELNRGDFQNSLGSELSDRRHGFPAILQHDTVLKPTECGGPLVDLDGKAFGINIARGGRTESFAIPSEDIVKILPDLKAGKHKPKD